MPACGLADRPKMPGEMLQTLKIHILRQREKLKQEQEQDAAMERHRREQEIKRKQNALSLEEINDQLTKLQFKVSALREEKHQLFTQLKKVCSEDEERKKQNSNRAADLLAQQQQQQQQQHQQQALQSQNQLIGHPLTGYPAYLPGALLTRPVDQYHRSLTSAPVTSATLPVAHSVAHAANGTVSVSGKQSSQKRRYAGSPLPVTSSRPLQSHSHQPQTSSFSSISNPSAGSGHTYNKNAINPPQSVPKTTGAPAGYPYYFSAPVPTTRAYDAKGNQCFVAVPVSENAHREQLMLEQHYQQQMRNMSSHPNAGSSSVMPIQVPGVKTGGISAGFPVQRPGSSQAMNPASRDMKSDQQHPRSFNPRNFNFQFDGRI